MSIFRWFKCSNKYPDDLIRVREAHYTKFLGPLDESIAHSTDVKDVHIDIYSFHPNNKRPYWTLITGGMSDLPQKIPDDAEGISSRTEIMIYVKEPQDWMLNVLKRLAEMPFDDKTYLHWYHTVPNGQPMTNEPSELTSFFFLPPYFEDFGFNTLHIGSDKVDFLWLIPITEREREYAIENGSQALEEVFEKVEMNPIVDEKRTSFV